MTEGNIRSDFHHVYINGSTFGSFGVGYTATCCANQDCRQVTLHLRIQPDTIIGAQYYAEKKPPFYSSRLLPESGARPQPDFIPEPLREDYKEACLIRDKSPKAAATLARRCLQGMIRDFCGISRKTLDQEIKALGKSIEEGNALAGVSVESVKAIDHVRSVSNIGAHMEADINVIVPVDPGEAQALIELIELLFDEWYVARERRKDQLARIEAIAQEKKKLIADAAAKANAKAEDGPTE